MSSKTARKSQVQEVSKAKVVIPDAEMIRQFRLNTESGIFTSNMEFYRATFRRIDELQVEVNRLDSLVSAAVTRRDQAESNEAVSLAELNELKATFNVTGTVEIANEQGEVVATGLAIGLPYKETPGDQG